VFPLPGVPSAADNSGERGLLLPGPPGAAMHAGGLRTGLAHGRRPEKLGDYVL